jgi:hypothetical protein
MNDNSSPGPDGFGPAFYKHNWDLVKNDFLAALQAFHSLYTNLRPINKSHIVLLPKKLAQTVRTISAPSLFKTVVLKFTLSA